ncbi:MAG: 3-deoxy-manno-octulosonate cytidylyltransferase [Pseudomonadota bacterium]
MKAFHVLIPARLESQRLPNKPLLDVAGLPLIVRVWQQACQSQAASVHVATDSEAIAEAVRSHGGDVVMTEHDHDSGTARIAEAAAHMDVPEAAIIVNLQGDEPAMPPACIDQVAVLLDASHAAPMATLWLPIHEPAAFVDANTVKLVCDAAGRALYFSRAPIPVRRQAPQATDWGRRHVGLYAYRANALKQWRALPASSLGQAE